MKSFEINCHIEEFIPDELPEIDIQLIDAAKTACLNAYAPYSHFRVGAAILLEDGTIVTGNNQENAAYPSGLCAERTAAFYAHASYPHLKFKKIAITCLDSKGKELEKPVSPCGACRQVLLEYEKLGGQNVETLLVGASKIFRVASIKSLLPLSFDEVP